MHDDGYFDATIADSYDNNASSMFESSVLEPTVEFLAGLAKGGPVLELGTGTGRVALPLVARGLVLHGIELSRAMAEKLQEKPGGDSIPVTIGDFSSARVEGKFKLAYLVFNTIMNLTTQEAQVACFQNVSDHLEVGGYFVIEVALPDLQRLPFGENIRPCRVEEDGWGFDEYDLPNQGQISHHLSFKNGKLERFSVPFRYVWPSELDLMAEMAGMQLSERWSDWNREPFTKLSEKHVSVWQKVR